MSEEEYNKIEQLARELNDLCNKHDIPHMVNIGAQKEGHPGIFVIAGNGEDHLRITVSAALRSERYFDTLHLSNYALDMWRHVNGDFPFQKGEGQSSSDNDDPYKTLKDYFKKNN